MREKEEIKCKNIFIKFYFLLEIKLAAKKLN